MRIVVREQKGVQNWHSFVILCVVSTEPHSRNFLLHLQRSGKVG